MRVFYIFASICVFTHIFLFYLILTYFYVPLLLMVKKVSNYLCFFASTVRVTIVNGRMNRSSF